MGITPVFGVSEADANAPYTKDREVVVLGGPRSADSYLDLAKVVQAALLQFRHDPSLALGTETLSLLKTIGHGEKT